MVKGTACSLDQESSRTQRVLVENHYSSTAPVTSGMPRGTVHDPLLFLAYFNGLPSKVSPKARLFADDCPSLQICQLTQSDMENLQQWESEWQMHFNPDKSFTTKRKQRASPYYIHGKSWRSPPKPNT